MSGAPIIRGEFVWLTVHAATEPAESRTVRAMITLASENGASLIAMFDGLLDGCVGMMPLIGRVRIGQDGAPAGFDYVNLITGRAVDVARGAGCRQYRPDHNGECCNCDEPFDAHEAGGPQ